MIFMPTWHQGNIALASRVLGRLQDQVPHIQWDLAVDGTPGGIYKRWWKDGTKDRYAPHEAFLAGQVVGINCLVPTTITDDDLWVLMDLAGRYKGISPYQPGKWGRFMVESVRLRRHQPEPPDEPAEAKKEASPLRTG